MKIMLMTKENILDETKSFESLLASPDYHTDIRVAVSLNSAFITDDHLRQIEDMFYKYGNINGKCIFRPENEQIICMVLILIV